MPPRGKAGSKAASDKGKAPARERPIHQATRRGQNWYDTTLFFSRECYDNYIELCDYGKMVPSYVVHPDTLDEIGLREAIGFFDLQQCTSLIHNSDYSHLDETCQFYANLIEDKDNGGFKTLVNREVVKLSWEKINEYIGCPYRSDADLAPAVKDGPVNVYYSGKMPEKSEIPRNLDLAELAYQYFGRPKTHPSSADTYNLSYLTVPQRLVYEIVHRCLVPTAGNVTEPTTSTAMMFYFVILARKINPGYWILKRMSNVTKGTRKAKNMPYGNLISTILRKENPSLEFGSEPKAATFFTRSYFENRDLRLIDGVWVHKPLKVKNKRAKIVEDSVDEEETRQLEDMYQVMKTKLGDFIQLRKRTHVAAKKLRAIKRALAARSFDIDNDI